MERRKVMCGFVGALVSGEFVASDTPAFASTNARLSSGQPFPSARPRSQSAWRNPQASYAEDAQLDMILSALESMPEELKRADPRTCPRYSEKIAPYLDGLTTIQASEDSSGPTEGRPLLNAFGCSLVLDSFVIQFGVPVFKIINWIKKARSLWGGVSGIWRAIRSGQAAVEIGEDAVNVLSELLGVPGPVEACPS